MSLVERCTCIYCGRIFPVEDMANICEARHENEGNQ